MPSACQLKSCLFVRCSYITRQDMSHFYTFRKWKSVVSPSRLFANRTASTYTSDRRLFIRWKVSCPRSSTTESNQELILLLRGAVGPGSRDYVRAAGKERCWTSSHSHRYQERKEQGGNRQHLPHKKLYFSCKGSLGAARSP